MSTRPDYHDYIHSDDWRDRREELRPQIWGGCICAGCGEKSEHVHHRSYQNLGQERPDDLVALCGECHFAIHDFHRAFPGITLRHATGIFLCYRRGDRVGAARIVSKTGGTNAENMMRALVAACPIVCDPPLLGVTPQLKPTSKNGQRKGSRARMAWSVFACPTCAAVAGERCTILAEDARRGYSADRLGTPRTGVHLARWQLHQPGYGRPKKKK